MQIKIEIDVKPEELRRFLGLPDVSGLQEDIVNFLRDKMGAASEFDATGFVKNNLDALRRTSAWKNLAARVRLNEGGEPAAEDQPAPRARRKTRRKPAGESQP
jgi:hypothetical protein